MNSISDKKLIKNHTVFFAYFCYLLDSNQVDVADELCEIGWKLDEEIGRRKISNSQINKCIEESFFESEDQLMIEKYILSNQSNYNN